MIRKNGDDLFIEKFKAKAAVINFEKNNELKNHNLLNEKIDWRIYNMKRKIAIILSTGIVALSGVCLAVNFDNIRDYFSGLGGGIDRAVQNGYIEQVEMEPENTEMKLEGKFIDNINTSLSIENFVMDDKNLSVEFKIEFDDSLKEEIDFSKIHHIELADLYILDENNILMYHTRNFDEIAQKHNLEYEEFDDKSMSCGLNSFIKNRNGNEFVIQYNIYTDEFPKSKELEFYLTQIKFDFEDEVIQLEPEIKVEKPEPVILTNGNWQIHLDVPEKFYNRTEEYYSQVETTNDKINVYQAKLTDTGIEIGLTVDGEKEVKRDEDIEKQYFEIVEKNQTISADGMIRSSDGEKVAEEADKIGYSIYITKLNIENTPIITTGDDYWRLYVLGAISFQEIKEYNATHDVSTVYTNRDYAKYATRIENADGESFYCTMSPSRKSDKQFIDGDRYDYYETFEMGKANSTDEITLVVDYRGSLEYIKLKKQN